MRRITTKSRYAKDDWDIEDKSHIVKCDGIEIGDLTKFAGEDFWDFDPSENFRMLTKSYLTKFPLDGYKSIPEFKRSLAIYLGD